MAAIATILGFDHGVKRIGVAVGQTLTRTATPLTTLPAHAGQPDWSAVARLIAEWQPACLVVGMPGTTNGAPHLLAPGVIRFAHRLEGRFKLPIQFIDERLSSHFAASQRSKRVTLDAVAAQLILETWLAEAPPRAEVRA
ncbi:MAG: Holliday junction resolvase RuvX [Gammaproteobacteria bacterium]|nr:Holliday junction resolvase RuvX [Gammaproteobacteria bacterium]